MSGPFSKHRWLDAVEDDRRITGEECRVLLRIGRRYVLNGGNVFRVSQATLAQRCRVSERTVRRAITKARDLGYLVLDEERKRGRGQRVPDQYRLALPAENTGQNSGQKTGQNGHEIPDTQTGNTGQPSTEIPDTLSAPTCKNGTTTVLTTGLKDGCGVVTGPPGYRELTPDPEPPRTCPRHPKDDAPCGACRTARQTHDAWRARQFGRRRALAEALAADVAACSECDSEGWYLDHDGTPSDPSFRCRHAHLWHADGVARGIFDAIGATS